MNSRIEEGEELKQTQVTLEKMVELVVSQVNAQFESLSEDAIESVKRTGNHVIAESAEVLAWLFENQANHDTSKSLVIIHHGSKPEEELFEAMYKLVNLAVKKSMLPAHSGVHLTQGLIAQLTDPRKIRDKSKEIKHHYLDDESKKEEKISFAQLHGSHVIIPICPGNQPLGGTQLERIIKRYQSAGVGSISVYLGSNADNISYTPEHSIEEERKIWAAWRSSNQVVRTKDAEFMRTKDETQVSVIDVADFRESSHYQDALKFLLSLKEEECALFTDAVVRDTGKYIFNKKYNRKVVQTVVDVAVDVLESKKLKPSEFFNESFFRLLMALDPKEAAALGMKARIVWYHVEGHSDSVQPSQENQTGSMSSATSRLGMFSGRGGGPAAAPAPHLRRSSTSDLQQPVEQRPASRLSSSPQQFSVN